MQPRTVINTLAENTNRQEIDFNFGWKFSQLENDKTYNNAEQLSFDDSTWRNLRLPHDWSIEAPYSQEKTAGATGYLPGGKAWYRKHFKTPTVHGKTQILFDGIYNHSKVWINGHLLGERPYGYAAFHYDLTPYLHNNEKENVLAVYVDRSRYIDSRWYTGSGIYRHVKLITTADINIPIWGTYITTEQVSAAKAQINVQTTVNNESNQTATLAVITNLMAPSGKIVTSASSKITLAAGENQELKQLLSVTHPQLWALNSPNLYTAKTLIKHKGITLDNNSTRFGIRSIRHDANLGFFLNDKTSKLKV
ncbi:MAG: sugar-binding domain-containing protein [Thalassotalea sp.]